MTIGQYDLFHWLLYFYIYSFFGWIFESTYVSIKEKKAINRGFLKGPFLPIYGSGAIMMLFVSHPFKENLIATYIAGVVGATLLELVTGMVIEMIFKVRYWDYSNQKFNYKGYICLSSSVAWGFFTIIMNDYLHPFVLMMLANVSIMVQWSIVILVSGLMIWDGIASVKEALDLRDMIMKVDDMRKEILLLRKRMDVVVACMDEEWQEFKEDHPTAEKAEEIYKGLEQRLENMKKAIVDKTKLTMEQQREVSEIKERLLALKPSFGLFNMKNRSSIKKRLMYNPSMRSTRYAAALMAIKEKLLDNKTDETE